MKTAITRENLIMTFGMKEPKDGTEAFYPLEKVISIPQEDEDGELSIVVEMSNNKPRLALVLPDGAHLYLNVESIEELQAFEKCIASYEPNC